MTSRYTTAMFVKQEEKRADLLLAVILKVLATPEGHPSREALACYRAAYRASCSNAAHYTPQPGLPLDGGAA